MSPPPIANPLRGESVLALAGHTLRLRPSYARLVAAEAELGPLFGLIDRAADGRLTLAELAGLLWHCLETPPDGLDRAGFSEALCAAGLARATPVLRRVLEQLLGGDGSA